MIVGCNCVFWPIKHENAETTGCGRIKLITRRPGSVLKCAEDAESPLARKEMTPEKLAKRILHFPEKAKKKEKGV